VTTPRCPHFWDIQPAEGPVSQGVCRICGQEREFKNSFDPPVNWQASHRQAEWDTRRRKDDASE